MVDKSEEYSEENIKKYLKWLSENVRYISKKNRDKIRSIFLETFDYFEDRRFDIAAKKYPEEIKTIVGDILGSINKKIEESKP